MALVWKPRGFFCYSGARPIEFVAGWRNEKLEWPGPPNIGEQLWIIRVLAKRDAQMGVESQDHGSSSKFRAIFVKNDGVGDFYRSRAFEYRPHSIRQFRHEPILILEFTIRIAHLAVRASGVWPRPRISRWP